MAFLFIGLVYAQVDADNIEISNTNFLKPTTMGTDVFSLDIKNSNTDSISSNDYKLIFTGNGESLRIDDIPYRILLLNKDIPPGETITFSFRGGSAPLFNSNVHCNSEISVGLITFDGSSADDILSLQTHILECSEPVEKLPDEKKCKDTDDVDYYTKGTVTYTDGSTETDYCEEADETGQQFVVEFSCDSTVGERYSCPYGCNGGKCLSSGEVCEDTDGGKNYFEQGTTRYKNDAKTDSCDNKKDYNLNEYICDPNVDGTYDIIWKKYNCPNGCLDGACLRFPSSLNAKYFYVEESNKDGLYLYISPTHDTAHHSEIYITAVFDEIIVYDDGRDVVRVSVLSNDPNNKFYKEFKYDEDLDAYNAGKVLVLDVTKNNKLSIRLKYNEEKKEIITHTNSLNIKFINRVEPQENNKPIAIPEAEEAIPEPEHIIEKPKKEIIRQETIYICNGCELGKVCYPLGYRKEGKYCSEQKEFVNQQEKDTQCSNSFECNTNLCIDNQCISSGLWQKFIRWLSALFG